MPEILRYYMATAAHITPDIAPTTTAITASAHTTAARPPELPANANAIQAAGATTIRRQTRRDFLVGSGIAVVAGTYAAVAVAPLAYAQSGVPPVPRMRRTQAVQHSATASALPNLPTLGIIALNRMGYGARPGDLAAFNALAPTPDACLDAYIEQQLNPAGIDDSTCDALIAAQGYKTLNKGLAQLWAEHIKQEGLSYGDRIRPALETERVTFLKAVYSKRQLNEVLAEHWFNHFNLYGWDSWTAPVMVHYDRDVIRANMLGNFRTMLAAVAQSPAMLYYLDNQVNSGGNPNENYARELFELHTLGAENYLGVVPLIINENGSYTHPAPKDADGKPLLYVDADVYGATTCFTGWRYSAATGLFDFDDKAHFPYQKVVLGRLIPEAQGVKDGNDVLDMLARHPGTARYISRKLCRRLISDNPPERIVEAAAAVFMANLDAPDQLKQVTRTILLSPEFRTTWGQKIKRPFEYTVSMLRAAEANFIPRDDFLNNYNALGQPLFSWSPPDGYPDVKESWSSTMPMLQRWRMVNFLIEWRVGGEGDDKNNRFLNFATPAAVVTPNAIVDYWSQRLLDTILPTPERQQAVAFLANGRNPDFELPASQLTERLPYLIGLILMSPSFQWR